jgi:hypothetical protein
MRTKIAGVFAAALVLIVAPAAQAAQTPYHPIVPTQPGAPATVQPLACNGTTGDHGCGPGFYWRNGDRGRACYPCD